MFVMAIITMGQQNDIAKRLMVTITLTPHEATQLAIELDFLLAGHRQFYDAVLNDDSPASEADRVDVLVSTASRIKFCERIVAELRADRVEVTE